MNVLFAIAALLPLVFTARATSNIGRWVALLSLLAAGLLFLAGAVEIHEIRGWPVLETVDDSIREFGAEFQGEPYYEPVMSIRAAIRNSGQTGIAALLSVAGLWCLWGAWKRR